MRCIYIYRMRQSEYKKKERNTERVIDKQRQGTQTQTERDIHRARER